MRGAPATHPKYEGRRIFGVGHQPDAPVLREDLAGRVHDRARARRRQQDVPRSQHRATSTATDLEERREKPWIAAVDSFAIGGACQWLLVMDRVIAETGSYFNLPARKEGIIPGSANLRLPRFVGERPDAAGDLLRTTCSTADTPEGRMLAAEVVPSAEMDAGSRRGGRRAHERGDDEPAREPQGAARRPRAARRVPSLHEQLRA